MLSSTSWLYILVLSPRKCMYLYSRPTGRSLGSWLSVIWCVCIEPHTRLCVWLWTTHPFLLMTWQAEHRACTSFYACLSISTRLLTHSAVRVRVGVSLTSIRDSCLFGTLSLYPQFPQYLYACTSTKYEPLLCVHVLTVNWTRAGAVLGVQERGPGARRARRNSWAAGHRAGDLRRALPACRTPHKH